MLRDKENAVSADSALDERPMEEHVAWPMISRLPVTLAVSIRLNRFTVRDLLGLVEGQTIQSAWQATEDVPLSAGETRLCWGEFEVAEQRMALRLTRSA